eukprot:Mrub_08173.p1 GENE.Mrub_08173~~Mrub_08173.p1  ORF type:complete len:138 (+),score=11.62 Mrub_08173:316-729(+)
MKPKDRDRRLMKGHNFKSDDKSDLGDCNLFEDKVCVIESNFGEYNLMEAKSKIIDSKIGNYCFIGANSTLEKVELGDNCRIGANVQLVNVKINSNTHVRNVVNGELISEKYLENNQMKLKKIIYGSFEIMHRQARMR